MRVALRRLRAVISLFSDMLADPQTEALKGEFKWVTAELGPAREFEVFLKRVVKPVVDREREPGITLVSRELRQKREHALARARGAVNSRRFRDLALDTVAWIETGDWRRNPDDASGVLRERPVAAVAVEQLRRRWKKILKSGKRLNELDPERRHRLRIQAKKLRYAAEFFATVFPCKKCMRRRKVFVAHLEQLQDALGDLNDIAVNGKLSRRLVDGEGPPPSGVAAAPRRLSPSVVCPAAKRRELRLCSARQSEPTPRSSNQSRSGSDLRQSRTSFKESRHDPLVRHPAECN